MDEAMEGLKSVGGGRSSDEVDEGEVRGEMGDMTVRPSTKVCMPELLVLIVVVLLAISAMVVVKVVVGGEFRCRILLLLFSFPFFWWGILGRLSFYLVLSFTRCGGCGLRRRKYMWLVHTYSVRHNEHRSQDLPACHGFPSFSSAFIPFQPQPQRHTTTGD